MTPLQQTRLTHKVQRQIARLLADLEKQTNSYVEHLSVQTIHKNMPNALPDSLRVVRVQLREARGWQWAK